MFGLRLAAPHRLPELLFMVCAAVGMPWAAVGMAARMPPAVSPAGRGRTSPGQALRRPGRPDACREMSPHCGDTALSSLAAHVSAVGKTM